MPIPQYKPYPLELVFPAFDSPLTDLVIELDHLRKKEIQISSHSAIFLQLKHIFHTIESIGSARIEGNNTTMVEVVETKLEEDSHLSPDIQEIRNMENTMGFIEDVVESTPIDKAFICEIHRRIVEGLPLPPNGEGDIRPGNYRQEEIGIGRSDHLPPPPWEVDHLLNNLYDFIQEDHSSKYDLLKSAIAHHRFVWIHPFTNGNGRSVRMLTYAMLIKQGFRVDFNRIINPTAVFCSDRNRYYEYLSQADTGMKEGILEWCHYVLSGLKLEIEKIDRLADHSFLKTKILIPAIDYSVRRKSITDLDARILKIAVEKQEVQAGDFKTIFKNKLPQEISRQIKRLRDMNLLVPAIEGGRKYVLSFSNNFLLRGVMYALDQENFLPPDH